MRGIVGILNLNDTCVRSESLKDMIRTIRHRGPDASGIYIDGPIGLAHARLSIIDLSGGHQPKQTKLGDSLLRSEQAPQSPYPSLPLDGGRIEEGVIGLLPLRFAQGSCSRAHNGNMKCNNF